MEKKRVREFIEKYINEVLILNTPRHEDMFILEETVDNGDYIYALCTFLIERSEVFKGNHLEQAEHEDELIRYDAKGFVEVSGDTYEFEIDYFRGDYSINIKQ